MALHHELPIYRDAYALLGMTTDITRNIPRDFKRLIGEKVREECVEVMVLIFRANAAHNNAFACTCGGDLCACTSCLECVANLEEGHRSKHKLPGLLGDVPRDWTAEGGVPAYVDEKAKITADMMKLSAGLRGDLL